MFQELMPFQFINSPASTQGKVRWRLLDLTFSVIATVCSPAAVLSTHPNRPRNFECAQGYSQS